MGIALELPVERGEDAIGVAEVGHGVDTGVADVFRLVRLSLREIASVNRAYRRRPREARR